MTTIFLLAIVWLSCLVEFSWLVLLLVSSGVIHETVVLSGSSTWGWMIWFGFTHMSGSWCCLSYSVKLTWATPHDSRKDERIETKISWGWGSEITNHSHCIPLIKPSHKAYQDSKEEEINCTFWWEELYRIHSHFSPTTDGELLSYIG